MQVYKINGSKASTLKLDEKVFGIRPNKDVVFRAVQSELTNSRQGTHASKNRSKVSGGGRKPFKQKGRGVARAGTSRSPLWKGGGTVFGPEPHSYSHKLTKKMKRLARCSVLSEKAQNNNVLVIDELRVLKPKTKEFFQILKNLNIADKKVTVLMGSQNDDVFLAGRNLSNIAILEAKDASTYDLIDSDVLLVEKAGIEVLTEQLMV